MRREDAIKKLTKLLGKKFAFEYDTGAPDADERADAKVKFDALVKERDELREKVRLRCKALLDNDVEYQQLTADMAATSKACEEVGYIVRRERVTVGTMGKLFFSVAARGDSWEDVIKKVQEAKLRGQLHIAGDL